MAIKYEVKISDFYSIEFESDGMLFLVTDVVHSIMIIMCFFLLLFSQP